MLLCVTASFYVSAPPPDTHSFPTRRSSDLEGSLDARGRHRAEDPEGARRDVAQRELHRAPRARHGDRRGDRLGVVALARGGAEDRKSTRLNSSHVESSYAVFCLKKKKEDRP